MSHKVNALRDISKDLEEELLRLPVGTEHVDDLVHVEFLHLVTGGAEVLPGIELAGLLVEDLTDGGGHRKIRRTCGIQPS